MAGVFREGHNKRRPRIRPPIKIEPPHKPWRRKASLLALVGVAVVIAAGWAMQAKDHLGRAEPAGISAETRNAD